MSILKVNGELVVLKCNCLTKTPEPEHHKKGCPVWLGNELTEAWTVLDKLESILPVDIDEIVCD